MYNVHNKYIYIGISYLYILYTAGERPIEKTLDPRRASVCLYI